MPLSKVMKNLMDILKGAAEKHQLETLDTSVIHVFHDLSRLVDSDRDEVRRITLHAYKDSIAAFKLGLEDGYQQKNPDSCPIPCKIPFRQKESAELLAG